MADDSGVQREYLALRTQDGATVDGVLYTSRDQRPRTAILLMHPNANFLRHYACIPLAQAGFAALGMNSRYAGNESLLIMEEVLLDAAAGVRLLRERGYDVVLLGNSGGGSLLSTYQSQAESPTIRCTPAGNPPDLTQADLPAAKALLLLSAHTGRALVYTHWLDPAVVDEGNLLATNPELDMFDARNGPPYQPAFVERYRAAQIARNQRITAWAREQLDKLPAWGSETRPPGEAVQVAAGPAASRTIPAQDMPFIVHRSAADLRFLDLALDPSDRPVGTYWGPEVKQANYMAGGLGRYTSLRSWLSQWSYDESNASALRHLPRVSVPVLILAAWGDRGVFPSDAQALYEAAPAADRELYPLRHADHFFTNQPELVTSTVRKIKEWLAERGLA